MQLFVSLSALLRMCVFHASINSRASIASLFPPTFHAALLALLSKLILAHLAAFRAAALTALPSPPLLRSFSTSVHTRVSSSMLQHLNSPAIFLKLTLQPQQRLGSVAGEGGGGGGGDDDAAAEVVTCELKQEALKTMLSGLEKIQEQLAGMH